MICKCKLVFKNKMTFFWDWRPMPTKRQHSVFQFSATFPEDEVSHVRMRLQFHNKTREFFTRNIEDSLFNEMMTISKYKKRKILKQKCWMSDYLGPWVPQNWCLHVISFEPCKQRYINLFCGTSTNCLTLLQINFNPILLILPLLFTILTMNVLGWCINPKPMTRMRRRRGGEKHSHLLISNMAPVTVDNTE